MYSPDRTFLEPFPDRFELSSWPKCLIFCLPELSYQVALCLNSQKPIKPSSTERLIDERFPVLQMVLEEIGDVLINHLISFFIQAGHRIHNCCLSAVASKRVAPDVDRHDTIAGINKISQMVVRGVEEGNDPDQGWVAMGMSWRPVDRAFGYVARCWVDRCRIPVVIPLFFTHDAKKGEDLTNQTVEGYLGTLLNAFGGETVILAMAGGGKGCQHDNKYVFHLAKYRMYNYFCLFKIGKNDQSSTP